MDKATGKLIYLNEAGESEELNGSLSFIGSNLYAYGADFYHFSPAIYGFKRNANGSLMVWTVPIMMVNLIHRGDHQPGSRQKDGHSRHFTAV